MLCLGFNTKPLSPVAENWKSFYLCAYEKAFNRVTDDFFKGLKYFQKISSEPEGQFHLLYGGEKDYSRKHGQVLSWRNIDKIPHT